MTRNTLPRLAALAVLGLAFFVGAPGQPADEWTTYGQPLSGTDTTKISTLMAHSADFVGKTVRVEGVVTDVCENRGCWMTLEPDAGSEDLRIKVDDGVIVFPLQARGKRAVAEGVFEKHELSLEQTIA